MKIAFISLYDILSSLNLNIRVKIRIMLVYGFLSFKWNLAQYFFIVLFYIQKVPSNCAKFYSKFLLKNRFYFLKISNLIWQKNFLLCC